MISQIIKTNTKLEPVATHDTQVQAHAQKQTTTKQYVDGIGSFLEVIGISVRDAVNATALWESVSNAPVMLTLAQMIGLKRSPAPWELQYTVEPQTTWGAHSKALMQAKHSQKFDSHDGVDRQNSSHHINLWGGENLQIQSAQETENHKDSKQLAKNTTSRNHQAPKMVARRSVTSEVPVAPKQAFVAKHKVIDTKGLLEQEITIVGPNHQRASPVAMIQNFTADIGSMARHLLVLR